MTQPSRFVSDWVGAVVVESECFLCCSLYWTVNNFKVSEHMYQSSAFPLTLSLSSWKFNRAACPWQNLSSNLNIEENCWKCNKIIQCPRHKIDKKLNQRVHHRIERACSSIETLCSFSGKNWKEEAWKKSELHRDANQWSAQYRCDAVQTELWSHTLGGRSIYWVHISHEEPLPLKPGFSRLLLSSCLNWKIYCSDHSSLSCSFSVYTYIELKFQSWEMLSIEMLFQLIYVRIKASMWGMGNYPL